MVAITIKVYIWKNIYNILLQNHFCYYWWFLRGRNSVKAVSLNYLSFMWWFSVFRMLSYVEALLKKKKKECFHIYPSIYSSNHLTWRRGRWSSNHRLVLEPRLKCRLTTSWSFHPLSPIKRFIKLSYLSGRFLCLFLFSLRH